MNGLKDYCSLQVANYSHALIGQSKLNFDLEEIVAKGLLTLYNYLSYNIIFILITYNVVIYATQYKDYH